MRQLRVTNTEALAPLMEGRAPPTQPCAHPRLIQVCRSECLPFDCTSVLITSTAVDCCVWWYRVPESSPGFSSPPSLSPPDVALLLISIGFHCPRSWTGPPNRVWEVIYWSEPFPKTIRSISPANCPVLPESVYCPLLAHKNFLFRFFC